MRLKPASICSVTFGSMLSMFAVASAISMCSGAETGLPALEGDLQIHDPSTIVKCGESYWVFGTGKGIISRTSKDLVHWSAGSRVLLQVPAWTSEVNSQNAGKFWAPDIIQSQGQYLLYYSVSSWGSRESAIGLAKSSSLEPGAYGYSWQDCGRVIRSTSFDDYNAIDPSVMLDRDGRLWLAFGSFWSGIKLTELDAKTGQCLTAKPTLYSLAWHESIEAACLYRHGTNYFLFVNWGQCCRGTNSTYEIRVGRSPSVTGPYFDRDGKDLLHGGGSLFLETAGRRIGPGHAGIFSADAREFVSYHFYDAKARGTARLEIAELSWSPDGWPVVVLPVHGEAD